MWNMTSEHIEEKYCMLKWRPFYLYNGKPYVWKANFTLKETPDVFYSVLFHSFLKYNLSCSHYLALRSDVFNQITSAIRNWITLLMEDFSTDWDDMADNIVFSDQNTTLCLLNSKVYSLPSKWFDTHRYNNNYYNNAINDDINHDDDNNNDANND